MMTRAALATGFEVTTVLSTLVALVLGYVTLRRALRGRDPSHAPSVRTRTRRIAALAAHPLAQFAIVCAVIYANQILFNAYVLGAHGGDPQFLARYLGKGWCVVDFDQPFVRVLAAHIRRSEGGSLPALSVLRVQAFLELPFTLFAYLAVARPLSTRLYRTLTRLPVLFAASVFFTAPFCFAEIALTNPWTIDDLVLRFVACAVVPLYVARVAAFEDVVDHPPIGAFGLVAFLANASAVAITVLALYDALLLYNLGHLGRYTTELGAAAIVSVLASIAAPRIDAFFSTPPESAPSPVLAALRASLEAFTVVFFVPSLTLRYWAMHPSAQLAGVLLVATACAVGAAHVARGPAPVRTFVSGTVAVVAGVAGAVFAAGLFASSVFPGELALAVVAVGFLGTVVVVARACELALGSPVLRFTPP